MGKYNWQNVQTMVTLPIGSIQTIFLEIQKRVIFIFDKRSYELREEAGPAASLCRCRLNRSQWNTSRSEADNSIASLIVLSYNFLKHFSRLGVDV